MVSNASVDNSGDHLISSASQIRQYQAALFTKFKFSTNTVGLRLATFRFFYIQVVKRGCSIAEMPYPRKVVRLPEIFSEEGVALLIASAEQPFNASC